MRSVWIADDDDSIRWVLEKALSRENIPLRSFSSADDVLVALKEEVPQVLVSDIRMPGTSGLHLLEVARERFPHLPIIIMTAYSDLDSAVSAFQGGAFEYLAKPFDLNKAVDLVKRAMKENEREAVVEKPVERMPEIIGQAPAMQEVFRSIGKLSHSNATVLVTGESGTGKELVARALHRHSPRASQPFVALNMAAIPKDLLESNSAFYCGKEGKKLIAVELAPPFDSDADKLMDAAHYLKEKGVDVLTFPDSPSGRTRADSILIAAKVSRQTGMCVMPHLCCRDKNAIAIRSQLLGAHINEINNFLVITGDPIPQMIRSSVKSVFNFDSVGLMNIIEDMNEDQFKQEPIVYGGAINQGRKRLDIEISRVKKKMEAGAAFFMTQPVFSDEDIKRLSTIKKETGARILCGIMPLVSLKNATFMKNEMAGIDVTDEVLSRYSEDMTKKEGEAAGEKLAVDMINKTKDIVDGYYFSFPFNRVYMLEDILNMSQI